MKKCSQSALISPSCRSTINRIMFKGGPSRLKIAVADIIKSSVSHDSPKGKIILLFGREFQNVSRAIILKPR